MDKTEIKQLRQALGITQKELADRIGVSINTIQNYERGTIIPPAKQKLLSGMLRDAQNSSTQLGVFNAPIQNNIHGRNIVSGNTDVSDRLAELEKENTELKIDNGILRAQLEEKERLIKTYEKIIDKHV